MVVSIEYEPIEDENILYQPNDMLIHYIRKKKKYIDNSPLPKCIHNLIQNYYWKTKFNDVINQMNDILSSDGGVAKLYLITISGLKQAYTLWEKIKKKYKLKTKKQIVDWYYENDKFLMENDYTDFVIYITRRDYTKKDYYVMKKKYLEEVFIERYIDVISKGDMRLNIEYIIQSKDDEYKYLRHYLKGWERTEEIIKAEKEHHERNSTAYKILKDYYGELFTELKTWCNI